MMTLIFLCANEVMTFLTIIIVFPGILPPQDRMEWLMVIPLFIIASFVWWLYLALFPLVYLGLWWAGELEHDNPFFREWPFSNRDAP